MSGEKRRYATITERTPDESRVRIDAADQDPSEAGASATAEFAGPPEINRCVSVGELTDAPLSLTRTGRAWEAFRNDEDLKRSHKIADREIEMLSQVSLMGEAQSPQDFVFVLDVLRTALKR